ncbi:MAG: hypothetical protein GY827_11760 [Cytophagales bacterium]|nr:hypothetical protein [Cytophagales bacterium]
MTINELIKSLTPYNLHIGVFLIAIPFLAFIFQYIHPRYKGEESPYKYIYSVLIYGASIPGIFGSVLTAYTLFILRGNLLNVNFLVYFLPVISMISTILLIKRNVNLDNIPGFERLWGLFLLLGITFILTLILLKTRIFLFFGGSIGAFFVVLLVLFVLLKWGSHLFFRKKRGHKKPPKY